MTVRTEAASVEEHGTFIPLKQFGEEADEAYSNHAM